MIFDKIKPVFNVEDGAGTPAATPPAEPPSNPTDANPEAITDQDAWVMDAFSALKSEDEGEDFGEPIEPQAPVPPAVSAKAENPEGAKPPSQPAGDAPIQPAALATPAPVVSPLTPPVPVVGAAGNQPVVSQPSVVQTAPADPTRIMAQLVEGIQSQRAALIERLAKETYAISDAEADRLGFTREQADFLALSQANAHLNSTQSMTQMQAEQLPVWLNGMLAAQKDQSSKKEQFFSEWPGLRSASEEKLAKIFESVNSLHPDLKGEAWRKKAGEIAHVSLGIPVVQPQANGQAGGHQTVRTPGPIVRSNGGLPHLPAGTSTAPAPQVPQLSEAERFFQLLQRTDAGEFEQ